MGRDKVQLYPFLGGESDQVDNMRKDGSDNMENKKALDAVNKKLSKNNMSPKIDQGSDQRRGYSIKQQLYIVQKTTKRTSKKQTILMRDSAISGRFGNI